MIEVIKLGADWCQPCQAYDPTFKAIKEKYDNEGSGIDFKIIDIEAPQNQELVERCSVRSIPTTVFIVGGEIKEKKIGILDEKTITETINNYR